MKLPLTEREAQTLENFIENHNAPCRDCSPETCGLYGRGICIAKNMDDILKKVRKLNSRKGK